MRLNDFDKNQKTIILIALVVMILVGLHPPWNCYYKTQSLTVERFWGHAQLFQPPDVAQNYKSLCSLYGMPCDASSYLSHYDLYFRFGINYMLLIIEWALVILIMLVMLICYSYIEKKNSAYIKPIL